MTINELEACKQLVSDLRKIEARATNRLKREQDILADLYIIVKGKQCRTEQDIQALLNAGEISCGVYAHSVVALRDKLALKNDNTKSQYIIKRVTNVIGQLQCEICLAEWERLPAHTRDKIISEDAE